MPGSWSTFPTSFCAETMLLLTDGRVLCQESATPHWWALTPDVSGSYRYGVWTRVADMPDLTRGPDAPGPNAPHSFASAVLRDGSVFVAGGEDNGSHVGADLLAAQVYDPVANRWRVLSTPDGWSKIGDACCCVLADGRVLLGSITDNAIALYNPEGGRWSPACPKLNKTSNEETWTLLPDGSVLTADCSGHPQTERYFPDRNVWEAVGATPVDLVEDSSNEIGPAILLPDGRVFAIGATANTALYDHETWVAGPQFPSVGQQMIGAKDAPAALLPSGSVLCTGGPVTGKTDDYKPPTYFFEFDPTTNEMTRVSDPPNSNWPPYAGRMLLLPTGQVLFANGSQLVAIYDEEGSPEDVWRPRITSFPSDVVTGMTYQLIGEQLNGLSQAVSYGDDATMATNYPIVRLEYANGIKYCRTANHSSMGVRTGTGYTSVTIPDDAPAGTARLVVIANGIPSAPFTVRIMKRRPLHHTTFA